MSFRWRHTGQGNTATIHNGVVVVIIEVSAGWEDVAQRCVARPPKGKLLGFRYCWQVEGLRNPKAWRVSKFFLTYEEAKFFAEGFLNAHKPPARALKRNFFRYVSQYPWYTKPKKRGYKRKERKDLP